MVRAYLPQAFKGFVEANTNFTPQGKLGGVGPPVTFNIITEDSIDIVTEDGIQIVTEDAP